MELSRSATMKLSGRERARWPALARMLASGELTAEPPRSLTQREKLSRWMGNEGYRKFFVGAFVALHSMVFAFGFMNYWIKDSLSGARETFGVTYAIGRAAALVLHVDVAMILFPVCRTLISLARQSPLNGIIQFDKNITFHKFGVSLFIFSWIHTVAHGVNFGQFASANNLGAKGFLLLSFQSGPGWSGYLMLIALTAIVFTSIEKPRRANYERFWNVHHLFLLFFIFFSVHGAFCMIKPDFEPFCDEAGNFWLYWIAGGVIYLLERIAREWRGRQRTTITKVVQHPSNVVEVQIRKAGTKTKAGQYIFLCCPEVSIWQYHPFTLTSAPEEDYLSIHVRCVGDFTRSFARALGCDFDRRRTEKKAAAEPVVTGVDLDEHSTDPSLRKLLPRIFLDGPFGSASEDVFKFEVAVLVGAGIGVTPFASILKSIWYRMNYPRGNSRLRKVYFFWVSRDISSFEWFRSLISAVEAQDRDEQIEIHTYLTAKIRPDDATNIMLNDANSDTDAITGLRAPTNFGRPNWDAVFKGVRKIHSPAEAGVFYCGPKALGSQLHTKCNMYSEPGFNFVWGKECF